MTADRAHTPGGELHDSEELSSRLLEGSSDRIELLDRGGRLVHANTVSRLALQRAGLRLAQGQCWEELWTTPTRAAAHRALEKARAGEEASFEGMSFAGDERPAAWQVRLLPLRDAEGRPARILAISREERDCTPDRAALAEREEHLRYAVETASVGSWSWDLRSGALLASDVGLAHFGLPPGTQLDYQGFLSRVHPEDRALVEDAIRSAIRNHEPYDCEYRCVWPDGSVHWLAGRGGAHHDETGRPTRFESATLDISRRKTVEQARKHAEALLAEREGQLALAIEYCPAPIAIFDRQMHYIAASRRWLEDLKITGPVTGRSHYQLFPEIPQRWRDVHTRCLAGAVERCEEDAFVRADGSVDWLRWEVHPWRAATGEVGGLVMFAEMITERKHTEQELRLSEERLRLAVTGAELGTWHWDFRTGQLLWSELSFKMFGLEPNADFTYEHFRAAVYPEDREQMEESVQRAIRDHSDYDIEFRVCWPDGSLHWVAARGRAFYDARGTPVRMEGVAHDITPHKQAEQALREGEARFRNLAEAMPHLVWQLSPDGRLFYANQRWLDYFGRSDLGLFQWNQVVHPDDLDRVSRTWEHMLRTECNIEPFRLRRHDGEYRWFACRSVPVQDSRGQLLHVVGTSTDVQNLKETEAALQVSRARLDTALLAAGMGTWVWQMESDRFQMDESLAHLLGFSPDEAVRATRSRMVELVHPDDREKLVLAFTRSREQGSDFDAECRMPRPGGRVLWLASKGRVELDALGKPQQLFGACVDITEHKRLEEELRQAQKMEAIGRLAGGVAHDFNNLLTVILGQASMIGERSDLPMGVRGATSEIISAGDRAAGLTAQLLAFGRRQTMQAKPLSLNDVVASVSQMLRRLLGENVTLHTELSTCAPRLHADSNMLTQVLLNLALNARDAMPGGGRLTIRTSCEVLDEAAARSMPEARAGSWACLGVSDTGTGISPEVLPRIFEPFFTTKEVGKGTGLGLATVYGIVKQHHGWIFVESEVGRGTTFQAYLPLIPNEGEPSDSPSARETGRGRGELILLVEDEAAVRLVVQSILEQHGYRLLVAEDGVRALEAFEAHGHEVALLLTDVVMPRGVSGAELAAKLQAQKPGLPTILCSGYSADRLGQDARALPRSAFLQKPYRSEQLLSLVRRLLDQA